MSNPFKLNHLPRFLRWIVVGTSVVLFIVLISWLIVPSYLKKTVEQQVQLQTGRQLTIGEVIFNPFTLTLKFPNIVLYEQDNKTTDFSADNLVLKISPASLLHFAPVLREVTLQRPYLKLVRQHQEGKEQTNFSDIFTRLAKEPSEPLKYSISNIQIVAGTIDVDDRIVGKRIHIEDIQVGLPFLSNFSKEVQTYVEPKLTAKVNGSLFELTGRSKPFSGNRETSVAINFNRFDITPLLAFSPKPLPFKIDSAQFSSRLTLKFETHKNASNITLLGALSVQNLALSNSDGAPLLKTKSLQINLRDVNLTTGKFSFNSILINEPQLWADLDQQGQFNWLVLFNPSEPKSPTVQTTTKPVIEIAQLQLKNGTVHWSDAANATPALKTQFTQWQLDAQQISTHAKAPPAKLQMSLGHKQVQFNGALSLGNAALSGQLNLSDIALSDYQPYLNRFLAANVSGELSLETQVAVQTGDVRLNQLSGSLADLKLHARDNKGDKNGGVSAKKIVFENASLDSASQKITIEKIMLSGMQSEVFRDANGRLNFNQLLKKETTAKASKDATSTRSASKPSAWQAQINQIAVTDSHFVFGDKSQNPAVLIRADAVEAQLEQVSSRFDRPIKMSMRANLNKTGKIVVDGTLAEKSAQLNVNLQNFSVTALQPYFTDFLNITLEKGGVSAKGLLAWNAPDEVNYQGEFKLENFASLDKATTSSFLRWKAIDITGVDVNANDKQQKIILKKIDLSDFYARAILSEQGKLNLQNILVRPQDTKKTTNPTAHHPKKVILNIGQINFNNGVVNYTDNFINPHFSMRMTGMKGSVGTLESLVEKAAPVNLHGKIDNVAPIFISGSFNPLFEPMVLDIKVTANDIDLPRLTSYSAKYAGYPIERGKLAMEVEYHLKDQQLTANNVLKIDQLTFGEKVDSPEATKLPVLLITSLLADRNGRINLDVPISGTLDDPEFTIGGVFIKVLMNMISKVITSPFALLANSVSGAEELSYVEFASGSPQLTDATKAKLDSLAKALADRPNLTLDIIGRADLEADAAGLRERRLARQIRKMRQLKEEGDADSAHAQTISETERDKAVGSIYADAKFDKPRNIIGFAKGLPRAEMEKLIMANMPIDEDDLRSLAIRRANAVRTYLIDIAHVAPERMYMIAPKISGDDIKKEADKGAVSRVDFSLRM